MYIFIEIIHSRYCAPLFLYGWLFDSVLRCCWSAALLLEPHSPLAPSLPQEVFSFDGIVICMCVCAASLALLWKPK